MSATWLEEWISKSAVSMLVPGINVVIVGGISLLVSDGMLTSLANPSSDQIWIHVVGLTAALLGYYRIVAAQYALVQLFRASVYVLPVLIVVFAAYVAPGRVQPVLILFGAFDLLGAVWRGLALRSLREGV